MSLEGRVVVITGAGRGLGREHALELAAQGALLVINDLGGATDGSGADVGPAAEVVAEIEARGGRAVANTDDVADWAGGERLIQSALDAFGRLDGLVNNAGILRDAVLVNLTEADWDASLRVNLKGHVAPARAAAVHWRAAAKAGQPVDAAIVNTSSESGIFGNAGQSNYAAAKAGVAALTEVWAKELRRYGVRVNGLLPRARTRLTEASFAGTGERPAGAFDKWDPTNVSPLVAYLLAPECQLTGEVFLAAGSVVQRAKPWSLDDDWKLQTSGRWDVEDLAAAFENIGAPQGARNTGIVKRLA